MTDYASAQMFKPAVFEDSGRDAYGFPYHVHHSPTVCIVCHSTVMSNEQEGHREWHRGIEAALVDARLRT